MAKIEDYEFTVKVRGTRHAANKILEQFVERWEDGMIEDSMDGKKCPNISHLTVSSLRKTKS